MIFSFISLMDGVLAVGSQLISASSSMLVFFGNGIDSSRSEDIGGGLFEGRQ